MSGIGLGALVALGVAIAPALGASDMPATRFASKSWTVLRGIGSFTPAAADPRLAAIFARDGLDTSGFRFTPSDPRHEGNRVVTPAFHPQTARGAAVVDRILPVPTTVALVPIAYDMGGSVGWKRFALPGDVAKVDLAALPAGRDSADLGSSYGAKRFSGRVKAGADRPLSSSPKLIEDVPAYSIEVGGSYALTKRLDVTAGVRYKDNRDRLVSQPAIDETRRDSQAVYIGTAFRF